MGRIYCGVVVSAGKMAKAVKVRVARQVYHSWLRKHFLTYTTHKVSDPNSSLRTGDVIRFSGGNRMSQNLNHVVTEIVSPWGPAIDERPPVLNEADMAKLRAEKRARKEERKKERREEQEVLVAKVGEMKGLMAEGGEGEKSDG